MFEPTFRLIKAPAQEADYKTKQSQRQIAKSKSPDVLYPKINNGLPIRILDRIHQRR